MRRCATPRRNCSSSGCRGARTCSSIRCGRPTAAAHRAASPASRAATPPSSPPTPRASPSTSSRSRTGSSPSYGRGILTFMADRDRSLTNELARERNREAADRTLLAWIRTSLAMISLGFGIERLGQAALAFDGRTAGFSPLKTRLFGAALIALGIAATLAGMWEHRRVLEAVSRED
ncbi:DUF202 domain-containing protein [bacterium]|nr:DUF202 domain-containing protein [bacterium]